MAKAGLDHIMTEYKKELNKMPLGMYHVNVYSEHSE